MGQNVIDFIEELNELQEKHGYSITWHPSGIALFDPSGTPPDGGRATPIGFLVNDYQDGGFKPHLAE